MIDPKVIIEARNLEQYFYLRDGGVLKAVDDVSFSIPEGKTLGLVGESGCGKSTTGRALVGMYSGTGGDVFFDGQNIASMNAAQSRAFVRHAQMIFQDPYSSLNPRMTVGDIVGEGIDIHELYRGRERTDRIYELLS